MTDNELIKVLEYKSNVGCELCDLKPDIYCQTCNTGLLKQALDLINRKDAEIERLQKSIKVQDIMIEQQDYKLKQAKTEAIKEFAERLKEYRWLSVSDRLHIDNLVKEMTDRKEDEGK